MNKPAAKHLDIKEMSFEKALKEPSIRAHARALARWANTHDPGTTAAEFVERLAA